MSTLPAGDGKTVGVLGGGQLGRMLAMEAHRLGYRVITLDARHRPCVRFIRLGRVHPRRW